MKIFSIQGIILISFLLVNISCLSRALYPGKERCFYENYYNGMNIIIKYEILDTDIVVPQNKKNLFKIYIESTKHIDKYQSFYGTKLTGKFAHSIEESDKYKVCMVANDKEIFKGKKFLYVQFYIQLNEELISEKSAKRKDFQIVDDTMNKINSVVDNIENMQGYQMSVEDSFSEKQINSSSRLLLLSICQIIIICAVGVYHIFSLRKIFKDKIWTPF